MYVIIYACKHGVASTSFFIWCPTVQNVQLYLRSRKGIWLASLLGPQRTEDEKTAMIGDISKFIFTYTVFRKYSYVFNQIFISNWCLINRDTAQLWTYGMGHSPGYSCSLLLFGPPGFLRGIGFRGRLPSIDKHCCSGTFLHYIPTRLVWSWNFKVYHSGACFSAWSFSLYILRHDAPAGDHGSALSSDRLAYWWRGSGR